MQTLTVAMVQCPLVWENPYANIAAMDRRLSTLQDTVDIIVLPEMFATGFTMNGAPLAEDMGGRRQGGWKCRHCDKRHLFRMAGEHRVYTGREAHLTVDLKGWRIRPFICCDLRFPVWCRNWGNACDMAIFVANGPNPEWYS
jgi:predicted amidohydrolase